MVATFDFDVHRIREEQAFAGTHTFIDDAGFVAAVHQNHGDLQAGKVRAIRWVG